MTARDVLQLSPLVLASLIPSILVIANVFVSEETPFRVPSFVTALTAGLSGLAVTLQAVVSLLGLRAGDSRIFGLVQLDLVSSAMLVLVCTLAVVVVRYSRTYLAGEGGLDRYARSLLSTIASVTVLVISNHLGFLIAGWIMAGVFLHQLLLFYRTRRQAVIVAHKVFLLGRVADVAFLGSLALMSTDMGSLRIDVLNVYADLHGGLSPTIQLATVLLVVGVLLKTAQLPFHGWMLQVMEAPTPVSSLLHAGVVNIGGFVMIRLSPLMAHAQLAQDILFGVGFATALLGSLVMMTRMSIKLMLAWSTIAQMGFMLVQCGLGVWHLALLHLLAHSFYKAHSFLTSGNVVETWRGNAIAHAKKSLLSTAFAFALCGVVGAGIYTAYDRFSLPPPSAPLRTLALALLLSFVPMLAKAVSGGIRTFGRALLLIVGATIAYFAGHEIFEKLIPSLEVGPALAFRWWIVLAGLGALFVAQTVLQASPSGLLARLLEPIIHSGMYLDDWFTRLTFRLWPPRLERAAAFTPSTTARPQRESRIF